MTWIKEVRSYSPREGLAWQWLCLFIYILLWQQDSISVNIVNDYLQRAVVNTKGIHTPPTHFVCCTSWHLMYALIVCCVMVLNKSIIILSCVASYPSCLCYVYREWVNLVIVNLVIL